MKEHVLRLPAFRRASSTRQDKMMEKEHKKLMAYVFLLGVDCNCSGKLVENLSNNYALGENKYPKTIIQAVTMVSNHKNKVNNPNNNNKKHNNNNNNNKKQKHIIILTKLKKIKITGVATERDHTATYVEANFTSHQTVLKRIDSMNQNCQTYSLRIQWKLR